MNGKDLVGFGNLRGLLEFQVSDGSKGGSDAIWVISLDLQGLKDLGGLTELDDRPILRYHPHCITTEKEIMAVK